jgi:hypothetical protein
LNIIHGIMEILASWMLDVCENLEPLLALPWNLGRIITSLTNSD